MKTFLTAEQAWSYLAKRWGRVGKRPCIRIGFGASYGLCGCIGSMLDIGMISTETARKMETGMSYVSGRQPSYYWWPSTKHGAIRRTAFAKKMVAIEKKLRS